MEESMLNLFPTQRSRRLGLTVAALSMLVTVASTARAATFSNGKVPPLKAKVTQAVAFDVSMPLRELAAKAPSRRELLPPDTIEIRPERGPDVPDKGWSGDTALQRALRPAAGLTIPSPLANFEGISNQDNFNTFGGRVNPPDSDGAVGLDHYVEMINLLFAVY